MSITSQQSRVMIWLENLFGETTAKERAQRFLEEALELSQCYLTKAEAEALLQYVYARPVGVPAQEVGGTMVCLLALCGQQKMSAAGCFHKELTRIELPEVAAKIKARQAEKVEAGVSDLDFDTWMKGTGAY